MHNSVKGYFAFFAGICKKKPFPIEKAVTHVKSAYDQQAEVMQCDHHNLFLGLEKFILVMFEELKWELSNLNFVHKICV